MRGYIVVLVLGGCGRIDFAALPARGDGGGAGSAGDPPCAAGWSAFAAPENLTSITQGGAQHHPALTHDEREIYFESNGDLFHAKRATLTDSFGEADPLGAINTSGEIERAPALTRDGAQLLFGTGRQADFDLFAAPRAGATFGKPVAIAALATAGRDEDNPTLALDDTLLAYSLADPANANEDLAIAAGPAAKTPYAPLRVLSEVNTAGIETAPTLSADGLELFFQTDRMASRNEIFVARRANAEATFDPPAVVAELAGGANDTSPELSFDGSRLYFASNDRPGATGSTLWVATRTCR